MGNGLFKNKVIYGFQEYFWDSFYFFKIVANPSIYLKKKNLTKYALNFFSTIRKPLLIICYNPFVDTKALTHLKNISNFH